MSSFSRLDLEIQLKDAGNQLLVSISTHPHLDQLLYLLDQVDGLLSKVEQVPSASMQDALYPSMKALISNQLLRHSSMDVKVSVASCMSELTRITAPDAPYDDDQMKEIFQLTITALGILSNQDSHIYSKALHILDNIAMVKSCLLMLDLECDRLVIDMFQQFLSTIRYDHPTAVVTQMEYIMTMTLEESEEISHDLLRVLLASVNKRNVDQNVLPPSWKLGERVLNHCAVELQCFLPDVCRSMNLDFGDYSDIVAFICQNSRGDQPEVAEADPSAGEPSVSVMNDGIGPERVEGTLREQNLLKTSENCCQFVQQENTEAGGCAQPENLNVTGSVQAEAVKIPKKRGRKPKSMLKPVEQYHSSATGERRESLKEPLCPKNNEKEVGSCAPEQSGSRQEERETNCCTVSRRPLQLENTCAFTTHHGSLTDGKRSRKARRKNNFTVIDQVAEADPSDSVMNYGIGPERVNGTSREQNSLRTSANCCQVKQQENTEEGGSAQPKYLDVTGTVQAVVKIPEKRGRKPKSMLKPVEQYHNSATVERRESLKGPLCPQNNEKEVGSCAPKQSGLRQEEMETNYFIGSPRSLQLENTSAFTSQHGSLPDGKQSRKARRINNQDREVDGKTNSKTNHDPAKAVVKEEYDDSEEFFEKHSTMPRGMKEYGQELVGRRVKIWWPMDRAYYEGAVASFDPSEKKHTVLYADGDVEKLNMSHELWKLEEPDIELHAEFSRPTAPSHRSRKRKINRKSESTRKHGMPSSSKRRRISDESKSEALKSGSSAPSTVRMADITNDESNAVDPIPRCTNGADVSIPVVVPSADP